MSYDENLANKIRLLIGDEPNLTEKKMFGGLAFLINGNMAVAASSKGGILVRVDPEQTESIIASTDVQVMEMRGKPMRGWLNVSYEQIKNDEDIKQWTQLGVQYASTLPAKS